MEPRSEQPARDRGLAKAAVLCALVVWPVALALGLFPFDSDAAFVMHDALWYGHFAERTPAASINPSHPLFHVLVLALVDPLRAAGVEAPGHVACRIVSGAAGAWALLVIAGMAGWRRFLAGAGVAFVIALSRGFVVDVAAGENVVPGAAAALFALVCAARPAPGLWRTCAVLTVALLLRQDNVLIVPGVAAAFARALPAGRRLKGVAKLLAFSAVLTTAGYVAAWLAATGGESGFFAWLLGIGREGPHSGGGRLDAERFGAWAFAASVAMTGRLGPPSESPPFLGLAYAAVLVAAGLMLRGRAPRLGLVLPFILTLAARAVFHAWFEADNFEWLILPLMLVAALASGLARGEPATALPWRRLGGATLVATGAWLLAAHGPSTWSLRERSFMESVERAVAVDRASHRFIAASIRAEQALGVLGIPHAVVKEGPSALEDLGREIAASPLPATVIWDRGLVDGMPASLREARSAVMEIDTMELPPGWEKLRRGTQVYGLRWTPGAAGSRPASR